MHARAPARLAGWAGAVLTAEGWRRWGGPGRWPSPAWRTSRTGRSPSRWPGS